MNQEGHLARESIARSYSALAQKGYFSEQLGGNELVIGKLMTKLVPETAVSFLEIGGAAGLWAEQMILERPVLRHIIAVEISEAAQDYQKRIEKLLKNRPNSSLKVIQADFLDVAGDLPQADVVTSSFTAQYMPNPSAYIQSLYQLVRPGGRLIFADTLTHGSVGNNISILAAIQTLFFVVFAYLREGINPPIMGLIRSGVLYGMYEEEAFKALAEYHNRYQFPLSAWEAEARKYPNARFYNLGIAGILLIPKPR